MRQVLLIDDEADIASLVSMCLDPLGIGVVHTRDLAGALDTARENDIGLILLDLDLGAEDGLDILPLLRNETRLFGVPVVAFTAHDSRRQEAYASGVDSFLARPYDSRELRSIVELYWVDSMQ